MEKRTKAKTKRPSSQQAKAEKEPIYLVFQAPKDALKKYENNHVFFKKLESKVKSFAKAVEGLIQEHGVPARAHVHFTLDT